MYETEPVERFFLVLRETDKLWPKLRCPVATCAPPLKHTLYAWRKNPKNLTDSQAEQLADLDVKHLATGQVYLVRLELRDIYQRTVKPRKGAPPPGELAGLGARQMRALWRGSGPAGEGPDTIEKHLEGILAHWTSGWLSTGYLEGLNSVFSAVKRKACGYRSREYMTAMLYFVAGKFNIPSLCSHGK